MSTGEAMETTDPKSSERTAVGPGQGESPSGTADRDAHTAKVTVHKLSAECPTHGTVPVVCPRCAGKAGGRKHKDTTWKRKKEREATQTARQLLRASPVLRAFVEQAEHEMSFQFLCDALDMSDEQRAKLRGRHD